MADFENLLEAVKSETIETRNQVIKSTNQVTKLEADVRSFDKKLTSIQSKNHLMVLIGFGVILVVLIAAAYWVTNAQTKAAEQKLAETVNKMEQLQKQLTDNQDDFALFKATTQREKAKRDSIEQQTLEVLKLIDAKKTTQAITKIRENNLFSIIGELGPVAGPMVEERLNEFRKEQSEQLLKNGRSAFDLQQYNKAIQSLEVASFLAVVPNIAENSLYLLGVSYGNQEERALAIQSLEDFVRRYPKSQMADDALYNLGAFCEKWENEECAKKAWQKIIDSYPNTQVANVARRKLSK